MKIAEYKARRASIVQPARREICPRCRKALPTCYCHKLKPFTSPVPFVILQHPTEARNAIATARMAHLSMTNSRLIVDRHFGANAEVGRLLADHTQRNIMLFPSPDAVPIEALVRDFTLATAAPPVFWVLDAKWAQVPKMLRLSPNLRAMPMVRFSPERTSSFQIRKQPHPDCLSTIEAVYLVIDRILSQTRSPSTEHHTLIDVFQYFVQQQLGFVDVDRDERHRAAKLLRAARRRLREASALDRDVGK